MKKSLEYTIAILFFSLVSVFIVASCEKSNSTPSTTPTTSTTQCPTTSACGCSAKNKADCEAATDCCKWTVGSGCGCK